VNILFILSQRVARRESTGAIIMCTVIDMFTVILQRVNRNANDAAFERTRQEIFGEYTQTELQALKQDDARRKFEHEEAGRFWSGA
jgi:carbamate kinase